MILRVVSSFVPRGPKASDAVSHTGVGVRGELPHWKTEHHLAWQLSGGTGVSGRSQRSQGLMSGYFPDYPAAGVWVCLSQGPARWAALSSAPQLPSGTPETL